MHFNWPLCLFPGMSIKIGVWVRSHSLFLRLLGQPGHAPLCRPLRRLCLPTSPEFILLQECQHRSATQRDRERVQWLRIQVRWARVYIVHCVPLCSMYNSTKIHVYMWNNYRLYALIWYCWRVYSFGCRIMPIELNLFWFYHSINRIYEQYYYAVLLSECQILLL